MNVKALSYCWLLVLLAGCASSTIEKRRAERSAAYAALPAEQRALVDKGDIAVGMSEDAVFIAWGKPDQVLRRGDKNGESTRWLYEGTATDTHYYWVAQPVRLANGRTILDRRLAPRTEFRDFVAAEIIFRDGKLDSWEMKARPPSRSIHGDRGVGF